MEGQSGLKDVVEVEKQELVDMAQATFQGLLDAISRLGGGQVAENLRGFAASMSQEVLAGAPGMQQVGELGADLWARWTAGLLELLRQAGTGALPDWLAALPEESWSKRLQEVLTEGTLEAWSRRIAGSWGPTLERAENQAAQTLGDWARSQEFARTVTAAARLQDLLGFLTAEETVALTAALRRAGPRLAGLLAILADSGVAEGLEAAAAVLKSAPLQRLLRTLAGTGGLLDTVAEKLERLEAAGTLSGLLDLLDMAARWDTKALEGLLQSGRELAGSLQRLKAGEILERLPGAIEASLAEARRDQTRYGAVRLLGTLKDPSVQEGVKLGLALLRHLPGVLGAGETRALPGSPPAASR